MFRLQDPFSRLHAHHATQFAPQSQPQAPQQDVEALLAEAKQRAIAAIRRPHQPIAPTPLHQVQAADDYETDEAPTSPCPPSLLQPGQGRSLFERTNFRKPLWQNERMDGRSFEARVTFAPPTGPRADREMQDRGRGFAQSRSLAGREAGGGTKPFAFLRKDSQVNNAEMDWREDNWAPATELYNGTAAVAAYSAEMTPPVSSPWKTGAGERQQAMEEDYVPPPAKTPPPMATWTTKNEIAAPQQPTSTKNGNGGGNRPLPLNLEQCTTAQPLNTSIFTGSHTLVSAVWSTPQTASFLSPSRAPLPHHTSASPFRRTLAQTVSTPSLITARSAATACQPSTIHQPWLHTPQPNVMPYPQQHPHISSTSALSFNPPLTPPLSSATSRPQLSLSIYLACLAAQGEENAKVMLKCKMGMCSARDGVSFGRDSLRNGTLERWRAAFGCGGCGEMLEVVVC